jgi:aspartyl-tRNA(Asn)/glutamyl-tRNA(Gln) amidotransferase subunit C
LRIDEGLIAYLEDLSEIALSPDEKERFASDLDKILNYMERLSELDTENVPERSHPFDDVNAFREDIVAESFDRDLILENAPLKNDAMFIAPKTVE